MIDESSWGFEEIRRCDGHRAARLESAGSSQDLIRCLVAALAEACDSDALRIALDSKRNAFVECRAIVQFPVEPLLYDWFFNARTGYRAQFWISTDNGMRFNERIINSMKDVLTERLPSTVAVRLIKVITDGQMREEFDSGGADVPRERLIRSLAGAASKIWIGERLYDMAGGPVREIGFATLSDAARSPAKLNVPRWVHAVCPGGTGKGEGLRAPLPSRDCSWLDLKGGFLSASGRLDQIKPQNERADHINSCGWT